MPKDQRSIVDSVAVNGKEMKTRERRTAVDEEEES